MKISETKLNHIWAAFQRVYADKDSLPLPELNGNWEQQVMRRIRLTVKPSVVLHKSENSFASLFSDIVWKLAPVSAALIVILTLVIAQLNAVSEVELAGLMLNDPLGAGLTHIFN